MRRDIMSTIKITKSNFEQEVLKSDKPVLIDFWATWCMPCKMISPVVDEIANEIPEIKVGKVNIDEQPELANKFNVMSIPTLAVIKDGKIIKTMVGVKPKASILKMLA
jgi:thioredoxin 1